MNKTAEEHWLQAVRFATVQHEGQARIGGEPYITHPLAVVDILKNKGFKEDYLYVGLFHDLLEDTQATKLEIVKLSNPAVLEAVELLTKTKDYDLPSYIQAIYENELARMGKLADRLHNLRSALVASKAFQLKYIKETEMYYLHLAKGTVFESDIQEALAILKNQI